MQTGRTAITEETRFSDLSLELATQGGKALHEILKDGQDSLEAYRAKKISQDSLGKTTKAPMIKPGFGEISFTELKGSEV